MRMQSVVGTMKSLLPQILNQDLLNAVASARTLELGNYTPWGIKNAPKFFCRNFYNT